MYTLTPLVLLTLSTLTSSHMIMKKPIPFAASKLAGDNGPLAADGSNYPCKFGYDTEGANNIMPLGSKQELAFTGGATHGGGSCQVSITYDTAPTKESKFKVIHSIIGGCPARNAQGNIGTSATAEDPDKYEFKIPEDLPPGKAVMAWTWFNKIGNREMYMNCAPITLVSGSENATSPQKNAVSHAQNMQTFNSLPDIFVANIGNGCTTKEGTDVKFDNPGKSVDTIATNSLGAAQGTCAKGGNSNTAATPEEPNSSPVGGAFFTTPPKAEPSSASAAGVENQSPNTSSVSVTSPTPTKPATDPTPKPDNSNTSPDTDKSAGAAPSNGPAVSTVNASAKKPGSLCDTEGVWNCLNGESYQRCASGTWSVVMPLAAGVSCTPGINAQMMTKAIERRFPRAYLQRHLNKLRFM